MCGYITDQNGQMDINLNAYDYFDSVLLNMIFGFISPTDVDLQGNNLQSYPKSIHNLANIASGNPTIGSLIPFLRNSAITDALIDQAKLECENALVEIQQNGDIAGFKINVERQNNELTFSFNLSTIKGGLFYSYIYGLEKGNLTRI